MGEIMKKRTTKLNVLYQSNDSYAAITGVSLISLLKNSTDIDELTIYVLDDKILKENKKKMKDLCKKYNREIIFIDSTSILKKVKKLNLVPYKGTYTTYFKLFAFGSIKTNNDIILQLDGDTIINHSLIGLCDIDLNGYIGAATFDCINNDYKKLINIPLTEGYYNCGVLLINQAEWRKKKCEKRIIDHLTNVRNWYFIVDQDIINVLFRNEIKYLDLTYNFNSGFYIYGINNCYKIYSLKEPYFHKKELIEKGYKDPIINHCMGAMTGRPWELDSIHPQNELFDKYLYNSPWKDFKKREPKRSLIFKIQKNLYKYLPINLYIIIHKITQSLFFKFQNKKSKKNSINN